MLTLAQECFGERNKNYTILGIEFSSSGPMVWYPKSAKNIVIQLSEEAFSSEKLALYQLAHETIHLLSPSGNNRANVLEEGLAVYFSWYYLEKVYQTKSEGLTRSPAYKSAGLLVKKILSDRPHLIKELRSVKPNLWELEVQDLKAFDLGQKETEMEILLMPFQKFECLYSNRPERMTLRQEHLIF
jgi:hypothetical protein